MARVIRPFTALGLATLAAVALAFTTSPARADDAIAELEKSLAEEHAALSTSDCSAACRALASIRRAADKICALEPGARCLAAHAKAEDATRRVREACPECAIASISPEPAPQAPANMPAPTESTKSGTSSGVSAESRKGGCASCDAGGASPGDYTAGALAVLALARVLRRRKTPSGR